MFLNFNRYFKCLTRCYYNKDYRCSQIEKFMRTKVTFFPFAVDSVSFKKSQLKKKLQLKLSDSHTVGTFVIRLVSALRDSS